MVEYLDSRLIIAIASVLINVRFNKPPNYKEKVLQNMRKKL